MMNVKHYDLIFAGGGLAGLSLAYHLVHSPLRDCSMLIVDRDAKNLDDRTWCFWTAQPTAFDGIVQREWNRIRFVGDGLEEQIDLGDYRYKLIRGIDFYRFVHKALSAHSNVEFLQGTVEAIGDGQDGAQVLADGQAYGGRWVFDSRFNSKAFKPDPMRYHYLPQLFRGWEIRTPDDAFDPNAATLLDFRTPQRDAMRFFYVLPYSARRALVEYVTLGPDACEAALKTYVEQVLEIRDYEILSTEGGINPMTDRVFPRRAGKHVMNIGTRGGRVKPSTGYAFLRIQQDSAAIVRSLLTCRHPFGVPSDSSRYRLYDALMLEVMQHHGGEIKSIFTALFKRNPVARVFRFLDEQASPAENAMMIASLPPRLFVQAIVKRSAQPRVPRLRELAKEIR